MLTSLQVPETANARMRYILVSWPLISSILLMILLLVYSLDRRSMKT